jgi:hypothetical protein
MEFRLPHINESVTVTMTVKILTEYTMDINTGHTKKPDLSSKLIVYISHDGKHYCSLYDEIVYIYGIPHCTVEVSQFLSLLNILNETFNYAERTNYYILAMDHVYLAHSLRGALAYFSSPFNSLLLHVSTPHSLYIKKPAPNQLIEVVRNTETIKIIERDTIHVDNVTDLENCHICTEKKAVVNLGCCNNMYCSKCATKHYTQKKSCAFCRKPIDPDKISSII